MKIEVDTDDLILWLNVTETSKLWTSMNSNKNTQGYELHQKHLHEATMKMYQYITSPTKKHD